MTVRGCFGLSIAHVNALGEWEKGGRRRRRKRRRRKSIFTVSRFVTLVTISSNLLATVRWGNAREQI